MIYDYGHLRSDIIPIEISLVYLSIDMAYKFEEKFKQAWDLDL